MTKAWEEASREFEKLQERENDPFLDDMQKLGTLKPVHMDSRSRLNNYSEIPEFVREESARMCEAQRVVEAEKAAVMLFFALLFLFAFALGAFVTVGVYYLGQWMGI